MQSASSRIWTRVAVSISYDDNLYTMGTSSLIPYWLNTVSYSAMLTVGGLVGGLNPEFFFLLDLFAHLQS